MTIRQQIVSDDEVRRLIRELLSIPEEIESAKNVLASKEYELSCFHGDDAAEDAIKQEEAGALFEVTTATGDDGKPLYKNEKQRDAAVTTLLLKNKSWIDAKNAAVEAKREKNKLTFEFAKCRNTMGRLIDRYYILKAIADMVSGLARENETTSRIDLAGRTETITSGPVRMQESKDDRF